MAQPPAYNAAPVQGQVLQASVAPSPAAAPPAYAPHVAGGAAPPQYQAQPQPQPSVVAQPQPPPAVQAQPQAMPGHQLMAVTCPPGTGSGSPVQIQGPGGGTFQV